MLDFMLYQCDQDSIGIEKEIDMIHGYIELEKLRYGDQLEVVFNHQYEDSNTSLAPLILLSFVENAFKHGCSRNPENSKIHIDLSIVSQKLSFKVYNTKPAVDDGKNKDRRGIGSNNVERQLELRYPDSHQLVINDGVDDYSIKLEINLK